MNKKITNMLVLFTILLFVNLPVAFALQLSETQATQITPDSALITWETDEPADSFISFGEQKNQLTKTGDAGQLMSHALPVSGLKPETKYYYSVESGGITDDNNGELYSFETLPPDTTAPEIIIEFPFAIQGDSLDLQGTTERGATVQVLVDGQERTSVIAAIGNDTESAQFEINNIVLADNKENKIKLVATDAAGNSATAEATVFADTSKPKIALPEVPPLVVSKSFTLTGEISEPAQYQIYLNNKSVQKGEGTSFSHNINLDEGINEIEITATDGAGWQTTKAFTINSDAAPIFVKFDVEKGTNYYEGRAESSIHGETKPGASVYLYIYKPLGYKFTPDFQKAQSRVIADSEGKFTFEDVKFEINPLLSLKTLAPKQVPSGLEKISILPIKQALTAQKFTYQIYLIAEDSVGRTAYKQQNIQVNSCFSGDLDFGVTSLAQFQGPLRLNPELMDSGRQKIQAVFDLDYFGDGVSQIADEPTEEQPFKINSIHIEPACTPEMRKDPATSIACSILPKSTASPPQRSADGTKFYVSWKLNPSKEFTEVEDDLWDEFEKRRLVFPLKLKIDYHNRQADGTYASQKKVQTVCTELGYFVDVPANVQDLVPDWLAEDAMSAVDGTLEVIGEIKPVMEEVYFYTGIAAMASFLLKTLTRGIRITSSNLEHYFTFLKAKKNGENPDADTTCPSTLVQADLLLDSQRDNYQKLYDSSEWKNKDDLHLPPFMQDFLKGEKTKDFISLDKRCPSTANLWKIEAGLDIAMKWTWDRAFCRSVPAGWTDTEKVADIQTVIQEQQACSITGRGVQLTKVENCKERLEEGNFAHTPTHLKGDTGTCWMTGDADKTLYVYDPQKNTFSKGKAEVYRLTAVGSLFPKLAPKKLDLLVYQKPGSEDYMVARDEKCEEVCSNPTKKGYKAASPFCRSEKIVNGKPSIETKKNEYLAGFTSDCFVTLNPADGKAQMNQCVCEGPKPDDATAYEDKSAVRKIGNTKEDWSYRQSTLFKEFATTKGRYYPPDRYYTGRDVSGAFGQNSIGDYFRKEPTVAKIEPHTGFVHSLQSVCLAGLLKEMAMLESILVGFRKCIEEAKFTGFHDAGMCKTLLTQHVCGLMYKTIAAATSSCTPNTFDDVGKSNAFDDIGVVLGATKNGMGSAISSSIDDAQSEYGNAVTNEFFKGGVKGFSQSICLAALGYDVPLFSKEFLLDAAYAFPMETSAIVAPAFRELSTYNPQTKTAIYNYEVGGVIFPGCRIKNWKLSLKCVGPEDIGNSGVDQSCNGKGCDCLQANTPPTARTKLLIPGQNLDGGRMFDIPLESPITVDGAYRYDHVMLEMVLDPSEKGNEAKCFDSEFAEGNKATYYFPITDVSPPGGFQCKPDLVTGRLFCPELFDFFDMGGAYMESPYVSCYNKETNQYTSNCKQPNLFIAGDEVKTKVHLFTDGKGQCLRRTISQNIPGIKKEVILSVPKGFPGPLPRPDVIGQLSDEMFKVGGTHTLRKGPSTSPVCASPTIIPPTSSQNVNQDYKFQFSVLPDDKLQMVLTRGIVETSAYGLKNIGGISNVIYHKATDRSALTVQEINEMKFNLDGFKVSRILENVKITNNGECAFTQLESSASSHNRRDITIKYDLLELDPTGGCQSASIPVKSQKRSHQVTLRLQKTRTSFEEDSGIHKKFMDGQYSSVHVLAEGIIRENKQDLHHALALYYDVASYVMEGSGITALYKPAITEQLSEFFALPLGDTGEFHKLKAYMCAVDNVNGGANQAKCGDIVQTTFSVSGVTAPAPTTPGSTSSLRPSQGKCKLDAYTTDKSVARANARKVQILGKTFTVHKFIKPLVEKVNNEIVAAGINYPSIQTSTAQGAMVWRCIKPTPKEVDKNTCIHSVTGKYSRSRHSYGVAIDISPETNPYCNVKAGKTYNNRNGKCADYDMPDKIIEIFKANDFDWGGDWSTVNDLHHFEWLGNRGDFDGDGDIEECSK